MTAPADSGAAAPVIAAAADAGPEVLYDPTASLPAPPAVIPFGG